MGFLNKLVFIIKVAVAVDNRQLFPTTIDCDVIRGSGCFFHAKMIAPVLLISNWLLPPGKAKHAVGFWDRGGRMRQVVKCRVVAAAIPSRQ